jgi:hypothetical protein
VRLGTPGLSGTVKWSGYSIDMLRAQGEADLDSCQRKAIRRTGEPLKVQIVSGVVDALNKAEDVCQCRCE